VETYEKYQNFHDSNQDLKTIFYLLNLLNNDIPIKLIIYFLEQKFKKY